MGYSNSQIGYVTTTLTNPAGAPTYSNSDIGYVTTTLTDPPPTSGSPSYGPSQIGYVTTTLTNPSGGNSSAYGPSRIGFVTTVVLAAHTPIGVVMPDGSIRYVPIRTWDGTKLR